MTAPPIHIDHLTKTFGRRRGVTDVSLTVEEGQVFGFLGPNGAGKSTTIRCLLGLYRPTSGSVCTLGHDPALDPARCLRDVGYLPGELHLPDGLTGADVLARFARMRGTADTAYGESLLRRVHAETHRPIRTLSKGNKQKLGLILAFGHRPRLLVLDEPTSGLDPLLQDEFAALVQESVADGRTVLLSSHDLDEVQQLADRVAVIREGRIVADDTVAALRAGSPWTMDLTFDHDVSDATVRALPGVVVRTAHPRHLTLSHTGPVAPVLAVVARLAPTTITARPADLDDLFRRLYDTPTDTPTEGARHAR